MAHNLARWTARIGLGERTVITKTLRRRVFALVGTDHPLGAPPHFASPPALALGNPVQSRLGPAASHSIPGLTAPAATELPTAQPKVPANSRHPGPREFPAVYSLTIPRIAVPADGHKGPCAATEDRPPPSHLPQWSPGHLACSSLTPFRCPHAVHRWIRAYAEATVERFDHYIGNVRGDRDYGRQQLNPMGKHPDDVLTHIQPIAPSAKERLGYPTQKPEPLLENLISSGSKEG